MEITKGTRHPKIIGQLGEALICNWLSRTGFEVAVIDHTGIDIVGYNPATKSRIGITVKSRTRVLGSEGDSVTIFSKDDRNKINSACVAFGCEPWIAVYVETTSYGEAFLTSLKNFDEKYNLKLGAIESWKMSSKWLRKYENDLLVKHVRLSFETKSWEW